MIEAAINQSYNAFNRLSKPVRYFPDPPKRARLETRDEEENSRTSNKINLISKFESYRSYAISRSLTSNRPNRLKQKATLCATDEDLSLISKKIR